MQSDAFQKKWEEIYSEERHLNRYPWDMVVSFIYRNYPKDKKRSEIKILEIGCGAGNNLWFAAREGFNVTGIDGSQSAINYARERFISEGLTGQFYVGDFTNLPFNNDEYDMVIDRGAVTCCSYYVTENVIREVNRVLKVEGKFFFNPYSDRHSSFLAGKISKDGLTHEINDGTLVGVGSIYFYGKREILELLKSNWEVTSIEHCEIKDELNLKGLVHADWRVIAKKK